MSNPEHNSARRMPILSITVHSTSWNSLPTSACFTRPTKTLHLKSSFSALTRTRRSLRGDTRLRASPPEKSKTKHYSINQQWPTQEPAPSVVLRVRARVPAAVVLRALALAADELLDPHAHLAVTGRPALWPVRPLGPAPLSAYARGAGAQNIPWDARCLHGFPSCVCAVCVLLLRSGFLCQTATLIIWQNVADA